MVRTYVRKTERAKTSSSIISKAVDMVLAGSSIRSVAQNAKISHVSLARYVKNQRSKGIIQNGYLKKRQVFSDVHEKNLVDYLKEAASVYFGLSPKDVRLLAYQCAKTFHLQMPISWMQNEIAGPDWFSAFIKRHSTLSVRVPEPTSLARASSFNKHNVQDFFTKLAEVISRYNLDCHSIWNVDESGMVTTQKPRSIVASRGVKQVGAITSQERGSLITLCAAINATGTSIPPMLIFPRKNFKDHFIRDGPPGCLGGANPSGWMTSELFLAFMKHFKQNVRPTKDTPVLLLLDNHESHLALEVLDYAKENGIILLSFPPHCSHRLQPLDRTVFGPLKKMVYAFQDNWMRNNPGKRITIYDMPSIIKYSWARAVVPANIIKGFQVSGIGPFNSEIFSEADFAPSSVTDHPDPTLIPDNVSHSSPAQPCISGDSATSASENHHDAGVILPTLDKDVDTWSTIKTYLMAKNMKLELIAGDGHCLLAAIRRCLEANEIRHLTRDDMCGLLLKEIEENLQYYSNFGAETADFLPNLHRYVTERCYNTEAVDIVLPALCNALNVNAIVYQVMDGHVVEMTQNSGRLSIQSPCSIHLAFGGEHYNAIIPLTNTQTTPRKTPVSQSQSTVFSPKLVRPLPKALARTTSNRRRRRRKSAILTDTPVKRALEMEKLKARCKKTRTEQNKKQEKKQKKKRKKQKQPDLSSDEEEEWYCLVCVEPYSRSRPGESWIQCLQCKLWAHEECTPGNRLYVCQNCDPDED